MFLKHNSCVELDQQRSGSHTQGKLMCQRVVVVKELSIVQLMWHLSVSQGYMFQQPHKWSRDHTQKVSIPSVYLQLWEQTQGCGSGESRRCFCNSSARQRKYLLLLFLHFRHCRKGFVLCCRNTEHAVHAAARVTHVFILGTAHQYNMQCVKT